MPAPLAYLLLWPVLILLLAAVGEWRSGRTARAHWLGAAAGALAVVMLGTFPAGHSPADKELIKGLLFMFMMLPLGLLPWAVSAWRDGKKYLSCWLAGISSVLLVGDVSFGYLYRDTEFVQGLRHLLLALPGLMLLGTLGLLPLAVLLLAVRAWRRGSKARSAALALLLLLVLGGGAFLVLRSLLGTIERLKCGAASGDIGAYNSALKLYRDDVRAQQFPAELPQLLRDYVPGWSGPYMATISADPWGNQYVYASAGGEFTIQSIHESIVGRAETIRYFSGRDAVESLP